MAGETKIHEKTKICKGVKIMNIKEYELSKQRLPSSWVKGWFSFSSTDEKNNTLEWKVYRSQIALCIYIKLSSESENENENTLKEMIRDQALDLGDWSNFEGFSLPLICLVQCSQNVTGWRKIAGDQEWLRGQLSLQIVESNDDASGLLSIVLEDTLPEVPEVRPLNDSAISQKIYEVLNDETKNFSQEQKAFLKQIAQAFETSTAINKLDEWEIGLIENYEQVLEGKE